MEKFTRVIAKEDIKTFDDAGIAQLGNLNKIVDEVNNKPIYKVYTAALTQRTLGAGLEVQIFENTIDPNATWLRVNPGYYELNFPSLPTFNGAKIWTPNGSNYFGLNGPVISINNGHYYRLVINMQSYNNQTDWQAYSIGLEVYNSLSQQTELYTALGNNGVSSIQGNIFVEIRLYP